MAIFGKSEKTSQEEFVSTTDSTSTTIITRCMEIKGDFQGCGTLHVDGTIHGDLFIDESVVIGKNGTVHGNIHSKKVVISGTLTGYVACDILEVAQTGSISDKIDAREIVSDGTLEATLLASDTIHITRNGKVKTERMESKHIVVNGQISGNVIASEMLEVNKDGHVRGKMTVKKIKVAEGGLMLGTMTTYAEETPPSLPDPQPLAEEHDAPDTADSEQDSV